MSKRTIKQQNVNGVMLSLRIHSRDSLPNSKQFTITYKGAERNRYGSTSSFIFAILFNIVFMSYASISWTSVMITVSTLSFLLLLWITHSVQSETLLVIPTIGIQTSIKYIFGKEDYFIPWSSVDDIIINEVVQLNRVLYYLTVLVKESDTVKLIPVFKCTRPRLMMLEIIYSELQSLLRSSELPSDTSMASGDKITVC